MGFISIDIINRLKKIKAIILTPLSRYKDSDFSVQQRVMFLFHLLFGIIIFTLLMISYSMIVQLTSPAYGKLYLPVLLPELIYLLIACSCAVLIIKGYFSTAAHMLLISSIVTVWIVIWFDKNEPVARLDTIVMIPAILSILPLLIRKRSIFILVYVLANIIILLVFTNLLKEKLQLPGASLKDFIGDTSVALLFIGIVGFSLFRINKKSLDRAVSDINDRLEAEKALGESEKKFKELTDLLPQTIFEADLNGKVTYINNNGLELFGYNEEEVKNSITIFSYIAEHERERALTNFNGTLKGLKADGNLYTGQKKDGTQFPIQVYLRAITTNGENIGVRGITVDISERIQAEDEIKKSRDQFQSLVSNIPGITYRCLMDKDWTMLYLSSEIEKLSGYSSEELIFNNIRSFGSLIHEEDNQFVDNTVTEAVKESKPWEIEYRIWHRDRTLRWVYEKGRAILDQEGKVEYLDGFILDITERKVAEKALIESEHKHRSLLDNMDEVVMMVDVNDRIKYVNRRFTEILGFTQEEVMGKIGYILLFDPHDQEYIKKAGSNRKKDVVNKYEVTFTSKDGSKIYFLVSSAPVKDSEGVESGTILAMVDITQRKLAEEALKQSEERYRAILESFPDVIIISDLNGKIIYGNEPFEKITGITPQDYANTKLSAHLHEDDINIVDSAIRELLSGDKNFHDIIEYRFIDKWGNTHWFSGVISKITLNNQTVLQNITRDITEKKLIEKELEKHRNNLELLVIERTEELEAINEELKSTNEELYFQRKELGEALTNLKETQNKLIQSEKMASLGVLAAGVAHEINNPLNFIRGGVMGLESFINDNLKEQNNEVPLLVECIKVGVQRAADIVTSLNNYSRQNDLPSSECDVKSIIENCLVMLNNQMKSRIEVTRDYTEESYSLICNSGRLHQVFLNILSNAIQAIEKNGTIDIVTRIRKERIIISISDTGCGISQDLLPKITDPFFTTKEPGKGTGLGLSITYNILRDYDGTLEFESQKNTGTKASISLPLNGKAGKQS
jgi:PAS domain S-box-containing protein